MHTKTPSGWGPNFIAYQYQSNYCRHIVEGFYTHHAYTYTLYVLSCQYQYTLSKLLFPFFFLLFLKDTNDSSVNGIRYE